MQSKEYKLPNGKTAVFEYDVCGIGKVTLDCMDELMGMIADRSQGEWIDYIGYDLGIEGQWLRDDGKTVFVQCDQCDSILVRNLMTHMNYCPNCGARMKGADDE